MEKTLNQEIKQVKEAIKNKLPTEHNFGLEAYLKYLKEGTEVKDVK